MELAARAIDSLMDPSASADQKAVGKRRLPRGPSVFRVYASIGGNEPSAERPDEVITFNPQPNP
jgi:hypothetical protein